MAFSSAHEVPLLTLLLILVGVTSVPAITTDSAALPVMPICKVEAGTVPGPPAFLQCRLQYYVQVQVGDVTLNQNFTPALNTSFSGPFGAGQLFAFNVTEGPDRTSRKLGSARGFSINTAYTFADPVDLIEVEFISYNDGYYNGTIQIQGQILAIPTNEVAIMGGTGSFRGAQGFGLISSVLANGNYHLFHHDLYFL